jgi:hypothetical protein
MCLSSVDAEHEPCNRLRIPGWAPTRVIHVPKRDPSSWYLRLPAEEELQVENYTTLSYRWGSAPFIQLKSSDVREFRNGNPTSMLPKTFQDAITVTQSLGIEFIWIDALCIIQDSEEDWRKESLAMYDVYRNSACNIAASASHNPYEGLFRRSNDDKGKLGAIKPTWTSLRGDPSFAPLEFIDTVVGFHHASEEVISSPLTSRAWIFQELFLAPRVLHFLESQLYWKCHAGSKSETFPSGLLEAPVWDKIDFEVNRRNGIPLWHSWETVITHYSRCNATVPSDKLVALSGIAKYFMTHMDDAYTAGMWKANLLHMLNWKVSDSSTLQPRPTPYRAPTWSWASIDSAVDYWDPHHSNQYPIVKILEVSVKTIGNDPTGHVISGSLLVSGILMSLRLSEPIPKSRYTTWKLEGGQSYRIATQFDILDDGSLTSLPLEFMATHIRGSWIYGTSTFINRSFRVCGLILKPNSPPSSSWSTSTSQHHRVGFFEIPFGWDPPAANEFPLAEPFGFKDRGEMTLYWQEDKTQMREFEIL